MMTFTSVITITDTTTSLMAYNCNSADIERICGGKILLYIPGLNCPATLDNLI
jgi:hypothetical protein